MSKYLPLKSPGQFDFTVPTMIPSVSYSATPMEPEDEEVLKIIRSLGNGNIPDCQNSEITTLPYENFQPLASFGPRCTRCGNPCGNDVYYHGPLPFHKRHFVCKRCNGALHVPITVNGDVYCQNCARSIKPKPPTCCKCHAPVADKSVIVAGKCFCQDHFRCAFCNNILNANNFIQRAGKFYCPDHIPEPTKAACSVCNLPIEGSSVDKNGILMHPECFRCSICHQNLDHLPCSFIKNKPYCLSCADKAQASVRSKRSLSTIV